MTIRAALSACLLLLMPGTAQADIVKIQESAAPVRDGVQCLTLLKSIPIGGLLTSDSVDAAPCDGQAAQSAVYFDRLDRVVRARIPLSVSDVIEHVYLSDHPRADRGQAVAFTVSVGPVAIQRVMTTTTPLFEGGYVHLKGDAGEVLTVPAVAVTLLDEGVSR